MPNLSQAKIAATLAVLAVSVSLPAACTKQADVTKEPAKATEVQATPTAASSAAPPPAIGNPVPDPKEAQKNDEGAADASVKQQRKSAGPGGSATGQMSCGAGKCSGEVSGKKK